jgi:Domain of unknown function (DUF6089)
MKKLNILIIFTLFISNLFSQDLEIGLNIGGGIYSGDIEVNGKNFQHQKRSNIGAFLRIPLEHNFAIRAQIYHGQFFANEKKYPTSDYRAQRGMSFNSVYSELSARAEWNFLNLDNHFYFEDRDPTLKFYSFVGLGAIRFKPQTNYGDTQNLPTDIVNLDKNTNFVSSTAAMVSAGAGGKFNITNAIALGAEISAQKPFTDYLDGIANVSSSKTKDYYFFAHLLVSYNLAGENRWSGSGYKSARGRKRSGCPTF